MSKVVPKTTIMVTMEKNKVPRPIINLVGNDLRKSSSLYRDVRIPRNTRAEVADENNDKASDIMKTTKKWLLKSKGFPVSTLRPPGIASATENIMVAMRVATTLQDDATPLAHSSPSLAKPLCWSVNKRWGFFPSLFGLNMYLGCAIFFTACTQIKSCKGETHVIYTEREREKEREREREIYEALLKKLIKCISNW